MTIDKENFDALVDKAMQATHYSQMRPVIEKELLHYDILYTLDKYHFLDQLTFQGGTALRLCYGGQRFSEDLDFAGGKTFKSEQLMEMKKCLEQYIGERYSLDVLVKTPKELINERPIEGIKVDTWQIRVVTSPARPDIPKQMIKIEVANIPAYTREIRRLQNNYEFLPDGYSDTLIGVESLNEVMADKLVSFPHCQRYIRYRDIWDLQWLKKQGATLDFELINNKINDYGIHDYNKTVETMITKLPQIIHSKEFHSEMSRFIPMNIQERTLKEDKFYQFLETEISEMLKAVYAQV